MKLIKVGMMQTKEKIELGSGIQLITSNEISKKLFETVMNKPNMIDKREYKHFEYIWNEQITYSNFFCGGKLMLQDFYFEVLNWFSGIDYTVTIQANEVFAVSKRNTIRIESKKPFDKQAVFDVAERIILS